MDVADTESMPGGVGGGRWIKGHRLNLKPLDRGRDRNAGWEEIDQSHPLSQHLD